MISQKIYIMKNKSIILTIILASLAFACTNLEEEYFSVVPSSEYGVTPEESKTIAGSAYVSLRGFKDETSIAYPCSEYVFFLIECVSDEMCVPTRGADWYDNGRYQEAQIHDIKPDNAMVLSGWRYCYEGISTCNFAIYSIDQSGLSEEGKKIAKAEIRGIRAYYYYLLLDWFGNVPIVTSFIDPEVPTNSPRADVYEFVETELLDIRDYLQPGISYSRFTQNVCNTLLARLYLNSEVFIGTPRWQDCLDACDLVDGYRLMGRPWIILLPIMKNPQRLSGQFHTIIQRVHWVIILIHLPIITITGGPYRPHPVAGHGLLMVPVHNLEYILPLRKATRELVPCVKEFKSM